MISFLPSQLFITRHSLPPSAFHCFIEVIFLLLQAISTRIRDYSSLNNLFALFIHILDPLYSLYSSSKHQKHFSSVYQHFSLKYEHIVFIFFPFDEPRFCIFSTIDPLFHPYQSFFRIPFLVYLFVGLEVLLNLFFPCFLVYHGIRGLLFSMF